MHYRTTVTTQLHSFACHKSIAMCHSEGSVYSFFVEDTRSLAPLGVILPPQEDVLRSHLWDDLMIDYYEDKATYSSLSHRNLTYRIPFNTPGQPRYVHLMRVVCRFETLVQWACVKRVVWKLHSSPDEHAVSPPSNAFTSLRGVSNLEIHAGAQAGYWLRSLTFDVRSMSRPDKLTFVLRQGEILDTNGAALEVILLLRSLSYRWLRLHVEISKISRAVRRQLQYVAPVIELITIDKLVNKKALEEVLLFLGSTTKKMEFNITTLGIKGKVEMKLPRGNISLSIGAVGMNTKVILSCPEELDCLTVGKGVLEHIYSWSFDIYEVRIAGGPDDATMKSRLARTARVVRLEMAPRLGALEGHGIWYNHVSEG